MSSKKLKKTVRAEKQKEQLDAAVEESRGIDIREPAQKPDDKSVPPVKNKVFEIGKEKSKEKLTEELEEAKKKFREKRSAQRAAKISQEEAKRISDASIARAHIEQERNNQQNEQKRYDFIPVKESTKKTEMLKTLPNGQWELISKSEDMSKAIKRGYVERAGSREGDKVPMKAKCSHCGTTHKVNVDKKDYEHWASSGDDTSIHPYMNKEMREIARDGMCASCKKKNEDNT